MNPKDYAQLLYEALDNKPAKQQDEILKNFKSILIKNKETYLARATGKEFTKIQEQKEQEKTTYISSASRLAGNQKKELEKMFPQPREFSVNQELLGGIAIRNKDIVYNATLLKKLEHIKSSL